MSLIKTAREYKTAGFNPIKKVQQFFTAPARSKRILEMAVSRQNKATAPVQKKILDQLKANKRPMKDYKSYKYLSNIFEGRYNPKMYARHLADAAYVQRVGDRIPKLKDLTRKLYGRAGKGIMAGLGVGIGGGSVLGLHGLSNYSNDKRRSTAFRYGVPAMAGINALGGAYAGHAFGSTSDEKLRNALIGAAGAGILGGGLTASTIARQPGSPGLFASYGDWWKQAPDMMTATHLPAVMGVIGTGKRLINKITE